MPSITTLLENLLQKSLICRIQPEYHPSTIHIFTCFLDHRKNEIATPRVSDGGKDVVYVSDIENAVRYSLFTEVPLQRSPMNRRRLEALTSFLDVIFHYAPVDRDIRMMVMSLRGWIVQQQGGEIPTDAFAQKVNYVEKEWG